MKKAKKNRRHNWSITRSTTGINYVGKEDYSHKYSSGEQPQNSVISHYIPAPVRIVDTAAIDFQQSVTQLQLGHQIGTNTSGEIGQVIDLKRGTISTFATDGGDCLKITDSRIILVEHKNNSSKYRFRTNTLPKFYRDIKLDKQISIDIEFSIRDRYNPFKKQNDL